MTHERFTRYETAAYLETDADIALYLQELTKDRISDPSILSRAIRNAVMARGVRQLAQDAGLTSDQVWEALNPSGAGDPSSMDTLVAFLCRDANATG